MYLLLGNPSTSDKLGAIVGGIIGAVFGILVLFIIIMILFKYKRHCVIPQRSKTYTCALCINIHLYK